MRPALFNDPPLVTSFRASYVDSTAKPGLAHVLMTAWTLDFESRDFRFLAQDSGILPTLQAVVTLTNTSDMACSALARPSPVANDALPEEARSEHGTQGRYRWTPWSLESVRESYLQVRLCRSSSHVLVVLLSRCR